MQTPPPTWEDLAWLRSQWEGPFLLKGVMWVDDAMRAVDAGMSAISVSNHGGNNLDGTPAPIRALPAIADAVGSQIEVLLDGGIRRGSDVVKALALGARAVMIGRAYLWALPPMARQASRTCSTSCATASARRYWGSAGRRSTSSAATTSSSHPGSPANVARSPRNALSSRRRGRQIKIPGLSTGTQPSVDNGSGNVL
jgi:FMN-dependent dehydrogenase